MKNEPVKSFEEFEEKVSALSKEWDDMQTRGWGNVSDVLFRGQEQASWHLETTLERKSSKQFSPQDYYDFMLKTRCKADLCCKIDWADLPDQYNEDDDPPGHCLGTLPLGHSLMACLRHNGVPSPLLDWTHSLDVAAFFAFESAGAEEPVAIYTFIEHCGSGKSWSSRKATIFNLGHNIRTHERHTNQQSQYTVCRKLSNDEYCYCSHEEAFARGDTNQDVLTKFIIPVTERDEVLRKLKKKGITKDFLFGSEESLSANQSSNCCPMRTISPEELERLINKPRTEVAN